MGKTRLLELRALLEPFPTVFPAKAGTQIHPERLVGFIWTPAFAGETGMGWRKARASSQRRKLSTSAAKAAGWSSMMKCSEPSMRLTLAEVMGA